MTNLRLALAAALLAGASLPALAVDTKPVTNADTASVHQATSGKTAANMPMQNNAQAGMNDMGKNAAPNTQTAMNTSGDSAISSDASSTQRKGMHLSSKQRAKADADEAETTRQLNQQAAEMAKPSNG